MMAGDLESPSRTDTRDRVSAKRNHDKRSAFVGSFAR
jgi:hypothetical protein